MSVHHGWAPNKTPPPARPAARTLTTTTNRMGKINVNDAVVPVHVEIRVLSLLLSTVISTLGLILLTYFLIDGWTPGDIEDDGMTNDEKADLLSTYNGYTATAASVMSIPIQSFVDRLLPVFFVCFATKWMMRTEKSLVVEALLAFAAMAISFTISQGLSAINVQFATTDTLYIMKDSDMLDADFGARANASSLLNDSDSVGHSLFQTSLLNAVSSIESSAQSSCSNFSNLNTHPTLASVDYGFHVNSWLMGMLPDAVEVNASFTLYMDENAPHDELVFPGGSIDDTAVLFSYGFWAVYRLYADETNDDDPTTVASIYDKVRAAKTSKELATSIQSVVGSMAKGTHVGDYDQWYFRNISTDEITMNFSTTQITSEVLFEAVTFELPLDRSLSANDKDYLSLKDNSSSDLYYQLYTPYDCADTGCTVTLDGAGGTWEHDVRLMRLCMVGAGSSAENLTAFVGSTDAPGEERWQRCVYPSNSSVLIYSMAQRIEADSVTYTDGYVALQNPQKIFSVTVGRLSWKYSDLAEIYGALCDAQDDCMGLHYALSSGTEHVIVSERHVPSPETLTLPRYVRYWQTLVSTVTQTQLQVDIISPTNYMLSGDSDSWDWDDITGSACDNLWANYVNKVVKQHIYSKFSLQPAYTAGMYWLFENAAEKTVAATSSSGVTLLTLDGNKSRLGARISIPSSSAVGMFIGCGLILIIGLLVAFFTRSRSKTASLQRALTAHNVAEMMLNQQQYPSMLVTARINQGVASNNGGIPEHNVAMLEEMNLPLAKFEIECVVLRHRGADNTDDEMDDALPRRVTFADLSYSTHMRESSVAAVI